MESQRNLLLIGLLFVSFLLWQQWESDKAPKPAPTTVAQTEHFVPEAGQTGDIPQVSEQANATAARKLITVSSDVLKLTTGHPGWRHRVCRTAVSQTGRGQGPTVRAADQQA